VLDPKYKLSAFLINLLFFYLHNQIFEDSMKTGDGTRNIMMSKGQVMT